MSQYEVRLSSIAREGLKKLKQDEPKALLRLKRHWAQPVFLQCFFSLALPGDSSLRSE